MTTKLTLSLRRESIRKGKYFAARNKKSLSAIVQDYFDSLETKQQSKLKKSYDKTPVTDTILKLTGGKKNGKKTDNRNYKEILTEELMKKYGVR